MVAIQLIKCHNLSSVWHLVLLTKTLTFYKSQKNMTILIFIIILGAILLRQFKGGNNNTAWKFHILSDNISAFISWQTWQFDLWGKSCSLKNNWISLSLCHLSHVHALLVLLPCPQYIKLNWIAGAKLGSALAWLKLSKI